MIRPFYFAYGSNLDLEGKLQQWAPSARLAGVGHALDRRLTFTRRSTRWGARSADILPHRGAATWGALFSVAPGEVERLDECEGVPRWYRRITVDVVVGGGVRTAFSYETVDRHLPEALPAPAYIATMLAGARAVGLPDPWISYLEAIGAGSFPPYPVFPPPLSA